MLPFRKFNMLLSYLGMFINVIIFPNVQAYFYYMSEKFEFLKFYSCKIYIQ